MVVFELVWLSFVNYSNLQFCFCRPTQTGPRPVASPHNKVSCAALVESIIFAVSSSQSVGQSVCLSVCWCSG